ncbi:NAD(P)/FAD-dependent oxidoreductase [Babesia caballi]|uniref:NAD(P)/FAD-dependent oxidoreductase n=1 Tax=Babesia caballi TaxID=5871 RepID=A0AAV4LXC8_BABCB|nr:NAD(P)/FAD-dependent oxidoreductase [Babesia caballi]
MLTSTCLRARKRTSSSTPGRRLSRRRNRHPDHSLGVDLTRGTRTRCVGEAPRARDIAYRYAALNRRSGAEVEVVSHLGPLVGVEDAGVGDEDGLVVETHQNLAVLKDGDEQAHVAGQLGDGQPLGGVLERYLPGELENLLARNEAVLGLHDAGHGHEEVLGLAGVERLDATHLDAGSAPLVLARRVALLSAERLDASAQRIGVGRRRPRRLVCCRGPRRELDVAVEVLQQVLDRYGQRVGGAQRLAARDVHLAVDGRRGVEVAEHVLAAADGKEYVLHLRVRPVLQNAHLHVDGDEEVVQGVDGVADHAVDDADVAVALGHARIGRLAGVVAKVLFLDPQRLRGEGQRLGVLAGAQQVDADAVDGVAQLQALLAEFALEEDQVLGKELLGVLVLVVHGEDLAEREDDAGEDLGVAVDDGAAGGRRGRRARVRKVQQRLLDEEAQLQQVRAPGLQPAHLRVALAQDQQFHRHLAAQRGLGNLHVEFLGQQERVVGLEERVAEVLRREVLERHLAQLHARGQRLAVDDRAAVGLQLPQDARRFHHLIARAELAS